MPKYIGHFELTGDFNPDEISKLLGIEPSWIHRKGGLWSADAHGPSRISAWVLYCSPDACGDVGDQVFWLIFQLWPVREQVKELCTKFSGSFKVYAVSEGDSKWWFSLSQVDLQKLVDLGVSLDCEYIDAHDCYCDEYFAEAREPTPTNDNPELIAGHQIRLEQLNKKEDE